MIVRAMRCLLPVLCALAASGWTTADTSPRIASINLCADQLLLTLADTHQIVALTTLSQQPGGSRYWQAAANYPTTRGHAEDILPLEPDLVIAGAYTSTYTIALLRAAGLRVEQLPIADSLAQVFENIRQVGTWLDREPRTQALIDTLQQRLDALPAPPAVRPRAALYDPNGYTAGNATLRGEQLERAGWHNVAADAGIEHYGSLSLEMLLALQPDAIIESPYSPGTWSRAQQLARHPALSDRGLAPQRIELASHDTICGGPWSVAVVETLVAARRQHR